MSRRKVELSEYGVALDGDDFADLMVDAFSAYSRGEYSFDELLLHPRDAIEFCDHVRTVNGFHEVPDEVILSTVMIRRKNPR